VIDIAVLKVWPLLACVEVARPYDPELKGQFQSPDDSPNITASTMSDDNDEKGGNQDDMRPAISSSSSAKHRSKTTTTPASSISTSSDDITLQHPIHRTSSCPAQDDLEEGRWGECNKTLGEPVDVDAALEEYEEYIHRACA
jgi:hypothetical protein